MKCTKQWLQEWLDIPLDLKDAAQKLTFSGLEVDEVVPVSGSFTNVIVGRIVRVEQHPNADLLHVCHVDVGQSEPLAIVCGGTNVRDGLKVAVAMIGADLSGIKIKKSKLRGVESNGMLCSAKELGLVSEETGRKILELADDAPIGQDVREYLKLNDEVMVIELTPNRSDATSIRGVARDLSVLYPCPYSEPSVLPVKATIKDTFPISVKAPEACPRYIGRVIRGVNMKAQTPFWMQERLRRCGFNCIHPIVDITNYVMLELGQPMHAFDLKKLNDHIEVRWSKKGEKLLALNDETITFDDKTLVIADKNGPVAIAGIMGGKESGISDSTQDLFLESAYFDNVAIAGRSRQYNLFSESSYRFERSIDFQLQTMAMERATQYLLDIVGGQPGPVTEVKFDAHLPKNPEVAFDLSRVEKLLGITVPEKDCQSILTRLGMKVQEISPGHWNVTVPSYRRDIAIEEDLIEEIARIYGYDKIPPVPVTVALKAAKPNLHMDGLKKIRELLKERDYHEVITYSFIHPQDQLLLDPDHPALTLSNPMSQDMSVMRSQLWAGLINTQLYNFHRQQKRIRIFESGLRFVKHSDQPSDEQELKTSSPMGDLQGGEWNSPPCIAAGETQLSPAERFSGAGAGAEITTEMCSPRQCSKSPHTVVTPKISQELVISGLIFGSLYPEQWATKPKTVNFFDIKGDVEHLIRSIMSPDCIVEFRTEPLPKALQAGQAAAVFVNGKFIGTVGKLHPSVRQAKELPGDTYVFELLIDELLSFVKTNAVKEVSKFPAIRRDLAIVVERNIPEIEIEKVIRQSAGEWLTDLVLFDVYEGGTNLKPNEKSLAFGLTIQHPTKTLQEEEIEAIIQRVIQAVQKQLNAQLRQ